MNSNIKSFLLYIISIACLLFNPCRLFSQDFYFVNYQTQEGLPSSMTYAVFQDSKGFIWIATDSGISRFDGNDFENFSSQDGLAGNEVFNFFEDSQGRLWLHTYNGQICYFQNEAFYNPNNSALLERASKNRNNYISHIVEDSCGNVYISSYGDVSIKIGLNNRLSDTKSNSFDHSNNYSWVDKNTNDLFLVNQESIIDFYNNEEYAFRNIIGNNIWGTSRCAEYSDLIYICNSGNLIIFNKTSKKFINSQFLTEIDSEIIHLNYIDGVLWLGTRDGVFEIKSTSSTFENYSIKKHLAGYSVTSVLKDLEGNLWFSTLQAGIFFTALASGEQISRKDGLADNQVFCISKDLENRLWLGTTKNYYSIYENGKIKSFKVHNLSDLEISKIKHFENGEHWILGQGLIVKHNEKNSEYFFMHSDDLIKDQFGYIWLGNKRLLRFGSEELAKFFVTYKSPGFSKAIRKPIKSMSTKSFIDKRRFVCFESNKEERMWAGATTGLYSYFYDSLSVSSPYKYESIKGKITDLVYDRQSEYLWVATSTNGIHIVQNDSLVYSVDVHSGLTSNIVSALHLDENNQIWVCTVKGLDRITLENEKIVVQNFSQYNGLFNIKVYDVELHEGRIYLATDSGVIVFPIDQGQDQKKKAPLIYLKDFKANERNFSLASKNTFKHFQNSMSFSFIGLSYRDQGNIEYEYKLYGADENWLSTKLNSVQYRALSPGNYSFEVKSKNSLGIRSKETASVDFKISAPLWQQSWFVLLFVFVLSALIIYLIRVRIKSLNRQHEMDQRLVQAENDKLEFEKNFLELEMQALRLQMNPHFLFNALNTIKGYYAENKTNEANSYISKFAQLLRLTLENSSKYISLEEEIKILEFYMQLNKVRYDHVFEYSIDIDKNVDCQNVAIPPMLLQPMIENAIIHGIAPKTSKGKIQISFKSNDGILISKVRDNGIGRLASEKNTIRKIHTSKGTQITQDRLAIINREFEITDYFKIEDIYKKDGTANGTRITIKTPLKIIWS